MPNNPTPLTPDQLEQLRALLRQLGDQGGLPPMGPPGAAPSTMMVLPPGYVPPTWPGVGAYPPDIQAQLDAHLMKTEQIKALRTVRRAGGLFAIAAGARWMFNAVFYIVMLLVLIAVMAGIMGGHP